MTKKKLDEFVKEAQREYQRQWRKKNPDKVRAKNRRFWERKALELAAKREEGRGIAETEN